MKFREFKQAFLTHVSSLLENRSILFLTNVDGEVLWNTYLDSFPPGTNEIYRKRREYDCGCCRHFIKRFGGVVAIKDNKTISIWDIPDIPGDSKFDPVVKALADLVKSAEISDVFVTKRAILGTDQSRELFENGDVHVWNHFVIDLPKRFVTFSPKSEGDVRAIRKDTRNVFKRSLEEISRGAISTVLDMIAEQVLYRGDEWEAALTQFLDLHNEYHSLPDAEKENYCWAKSVELSGAVSKIKNHSIGTLLQDFTAGVEAIEAVRKYEAVVAPTNYKRPKAIFTAAMVEQAEETVTELGVLHSLGRRHAVLSDITINNVVWADRDATIHMNGANSIFEILKQETTVDPKRFDRVPSMDADSFFEQTLPGVKHLEIMLENRHESSLVSLVAPQAADSPTLFKWNNAFSWAYNGNIADSMKQRVKAAGGNIEGVLRFSLQWNTERDNRNDFDAHCVEPNGNHIWFRNKGRRHPSSGMLDVDIIHPQLGQIAVENITWIDPARMQEGVYEFYIHNYSHRGGRSGFDAEIEYDGQLYEYSYHKELAQSERVIVAKLKFSRQNGIEFIKTLPTTTTAKTVWGLKTNRFQPVSVCMFSPNYWDGQRGIGHKHFMLMLSDCQNDSQPNGFFNEYLRQDFMPHKRVFEALGSKMRVERSENQLSGLGFSSTKRNSLICRIDNDRLVKVIF